MKVFEITAWSYSADRPNETSIKVSINSEVFPGIFQGVNYEFLLPQRFETMSDEFKNAVGLVLSNAGLL